MPKFTPLSFSLPKAPSRQVIHSLDKYSFKEVLELKNIVDDISKKAINNINMMEKVINRFKNAAKNIDHQKTQERLDNWRVEDLISKDRFKKILLQEIERRMS